MARDSSTAEGAFLKLFEGNLVNEINQTRSDACLITRCLLGSPSASPPAMPKANWVIYLCIKYYVVKKGTSLHSRVLLREGEAGTYNTR